MQCTTCTAVLGRRASLSPTAEFLSFMYYGIFFTLSWPLALSLPSPPGRGKKMLNPVSSAHISFSSPPASFQIACAAGRSEFWETWTHHPGQGCW